MALGGGTFTSQNKKLPGVYLNFVSAKKDYSAMGERGTAALPLVLDWGPENTVEKLEASEFVQEARKRLGYDAQAPELLPFREVFRNAKALYYSRLNGGARAENEFASARFSGSRGNALKIVIQTVPSGNEVPKEGEPARYQVITLLDGREEDTQIVSASSELVPNAYVEFKADAALKETAGTPLSGGTSGETVTGEDFQRFLDQIQAYSFHTLGCPWEEPQASALFAAFTRRMRDELGVKFQTVLFRCPAGYEGVLSVENSVKGQAGGPSLVYWVTGASAGCAVNASNTNRAYDGELAVDTSHTQAQLAEGLRQGKFLFHRCGDQIRVLEDVNTLTGFTEEKGEDFRFNQTIRVLDQIAMDVGSLFVSRYLGRIPNDAPGRISLWNDLVTHHRELERLRAIENFDPEQIQVEQGNTKKSVAVRDRVQVTGAMSQLYMRITVE